MEPSSPAGGDHESPPDRALTRSAAEGPAVEIAIDGVMVGPAAAFPQDHAADDEVGWVCDPLDPNGW